MDGWEEELLKGEFMTKRRLTEKFPRSSKIEKELFLCSSICGNELNCRYYWSKTQTDDMSEKYQS